MMNANTGRMMNVLPHIQQSIRDILWTRYGTRVQREEYGSLLPDLIDQPFTEANRLRIAASVFMALAAWEPRVTVTNVDVSAPEVSGKIAITVHAQVNGVAEKFTLER